MGVFLHMQPGRANYGNRVFPLPSPQVTPVYRQDEDGVHFHNSQEEDGIGWKLYVPIELRSEPSLTLRLNFFAQQPGLVECSLYVYGVDELTAIETGQYLSGPFPLVFAAPLAGVGYYATYVDFDIQNTPMPPINPNTTHLQVYLARSFNEAPDVEDIIFFNGRTLPVFP